MYKYLQEYETTDKVTSLLINEFNDYLKELGYSYFREVVMDVLIEKTNSYLQMADFIDMERDNLSILSKKITAYFDDILGESQNWEYHILDISWLNKHKTLFQFQKSYKEIGFRINFEIYLDKSGWIGISEWGKRDKEELSKYLSKKVSSSWKLEDDEWVTLFRDLKSIEISNLFNGNFIKNKEMVSDFINLFEIAKPYIKKRGQSA